MDNDILNTRSQYRRPKDRISYVPTNQERQQNSNNTLNAGPQYRRPKERISYTPTNEEQQNNTVDVREYRKKKNQKLLEQAPEIEKKSEKRNRAHTTTFILMLATAIFFDVVQAYLDLIPLLGWMLSGLLGLFAWLTFYVWTSIKGWGFSDTMKQVLVNWIIPFVEVIPILNLLPAWTLKVVITYFFLKSEDLLYNATGGKADAEKLADIYKKLT